MFTVRLATNYPYNFERVKFYIFRMPQLSLIVQDPIHKNIFDFLLDISNNRFFPHLVGKEVNKEAKTNLFHFYIKFDYGIAL